MRVPTRNALLAAGAGGGGGGGGAAYVTEHHYVTDGSRSISFAGAAAGNLAIVIVTGFNASVAVPTGWTFLAAFTWSSTPGATYIYYKVLSAGDIAAGSQNFIFLGTGGTQMAVFYSGATVVAVASSGDAATDQVDMPGFTKNVSCKALVMAMGDGDVTAVPVAPGTTVNRIGLLGGSLYVTRLEDILNPANYTDGSTLSYTACKLIGTVAFILQLT